MAIGYACLTIGVQNTGFSRCSLKDASEEKIRAVAKHNLESLSKIIDYNILNNIKLFRISSDIIPLASHPINKIIWQEEFKVILADIGEKIILSGMRVSMHPGQYTILNSTNPKIVEKAILDLQYHEDFLNALRVDNKSKIILHIGGVYGDKKNSLKSFIQNYSQLNENIKKRLIIENDDKCYNIYDTLGIFKKTGIPVVFDTLHHMLNHEQDNLTDINWIELCSKTWKDEDGKQKIHYSQQKTGARAGSHSQTIFINDFNNFISENKNVLDTCDIMLEVKDKNLSAIKCINTCIHDLSSHKLEKEWAIYKYFVLSKSAKIYDEIRQLLKEKDQNISIQFYEMIEQAILKNEDIGAEVNAAEHIWGYFKNEATITEKKRYQKLINEYRNKNNNINIVKNHLLKLANRTSNQYLINSLYFYL
jgi:UV DNA damage endonuclease